MIPAVCTVWLVLEFSKYIDDPILVCPLLFHFAGPDSGGGGGGGGEAR